jgi:ribosomal protein L7/L12
MDLRDFGEYVEYTQMEATSALNLIHLLNSHTPIDTELRFKKDPGLNEGAHRKILAIKILRDATGGSLKHTKAIVDGEATIPIGRVSPEVLGKIADAGYIVEHLAGRV